MFPGQPRLIVRFFPKEHLISGESRVPGLWLSQVLWLWLRWRAWSYGGRELGIVFQSNLRLNARGLADRHQFQVCLLAKSLGITRLIPTGNFITSFISSLVTVPTVKVQQLHSEMAVTANKGHVTACYTM